MILHSERALPLSMPLETPLRPLRDSYWMDSSAARIMVRHGRWLLAFGVAIQNGRIVIADWRV
jgi:hypothetical protein